MCEGGYVRAHTCVKGCMCERVYVCEEGERDDAKSELTVSKNISTHSFTLNNYMKGAQTSWWTSHTPYCSWHLF